MKKDFALVIVAGGNSTRFGDNKLLFLLKDEPLIIHSVQTAIETLSVEQVVVVVPEKQKKQYQQILEKINKDIVLIKGGERRQDSALNGIKYFDGYEYVGVHDAARPFLSSHLLRKLIDFSKEKGSAICAVKLNDTIKKVTQEGQVIETLDREELCATQTPQIFLQKEIKQAYEKNTKIIITDEAMAMEKLGIKSHIFLHNEKNDKITYQEDLIL